MTTTNNLPPTSLADSVVVNYQGNTRKISLPNLGQLLGNGGDGGNGTPLATEIIDRQAADNLGDVLFAQVQSSTAQSVTATIPSAQSHLTLTDGRLVQFRWGNTNTGPDPVITIDGNAFTVRRRNGGALDAGDLGGNQRYLGYILTTNPRIIRLVTSVGIDDISGLQDLSATSDILVADTFSSGEIPPGPQQSTYTLRAIQSHIPLSAGRIVQFHWAHTNIGPDPIARIRDENFTIRGRNGTPVAAGDIVGGNRYLAFVQNTAPRQLRLVGSIGTSDISGLDVQLGQRSLAIRDSGILPITNVAGTGDAITADLTAAMISAGITTLSAVSEIEYVPQITNGAVNPTLTIGGSTYGIRGADGQTWPANGFVVGRSYKLRRRNTTLRVVGGDVTAAETAQMRLDRIVAAAQTGTVALESIAGTGDAITAAVPSVLANLGVAAANLRRIRFQAAATNTGAVTINIDSVGAVSLRDTAGAVLAAAYLVAGRYYEAIKAGTIWRVVAGDVTAAELAQVQLDRIAAVTAEAAMRGDADTALALGIEEIDDEMSAPMEVILSDTTYWSQFDKGGHAVGGWDGTGYVSVLADRTLANAAPRIFAIPGLEIVETTTEGQQMRGLEFDASGNAIWVWRYGSDGGFDGHFAQAFWDRARDKLDLDNLNGVLSKTKLQAYTQMCQSLGVGGDFDAATTRDWVMAHAAELTPGGYLMLEGLYNIDGQTIYTDGPRSKAYDRTRAATGLTPALPPLTAVSAPFPLAAALNAMRAEFDLPQIPIVTTAHGIPGIAIEEIDDDTATGTGATLIWDNMSWYYDELKRVATAAGLELEVRWHDWLHGTSAKSSARGVYLARLWDYHADFHALLTAKGISGPAVMVMGQPSGDANSTNDGATAWSCRDDVLDFCEQGGGVLATCEYWFEIADNNVHPAAKATILMQETRALRVAEAEAGLPVTIRRPGMSIAGGVITLDFANLRQDEYLVMHDAAKYAGVGIDQWGGFELRGGSAIITGLTLMGHRARLTYTGTPASLHYCQQVQDVSANASNRYVAQRGLLRTSTVRPSKWFAGELLYRPIPAFNVTIS